MTPSKSLRHAPDFAYAEFTPAKSGVAFQGNAARALPMELFTKS